MEGETTLDEERKLGDWLRTHEVDDALKPYQQMFAAFDEGLPLEQPHEPTVAHHKRLVWWHWAAAVVIGLLALGAVRMSMRPTPAVEQPPVTAQVAPDTTLTKSVANTERLAKVRQVAEKAVQPVKATAKPKAKVQPSPTQVANEDSAEIVRTAGDLELAESEYLAEQVELERQLLELRRQRVAQQSGWHYTSLPCE